MKAVIARVFIWLLALAAGRIDASAQDFARMTPEERQAYFARIQEDSHRDWRAMMDRLAIVEPALPPPSEDPRRPSGLVQREGSTNWFDAAGRFHVRSNWGHWTNYADSLNGNPRLPDPLVTGDGRPVSDAGTWWNARRPEILELYRREVYGRIPPDVPSPRFEATSVDSTALGGTAIVKQVVGTIDNSRYPAATPRIVLTMILPRAADGPVPVILRIGGFWGWSPERGVDGLPGDVRQVLQKGWGFVAFDPYALQADHGAGLAEGIIGLVAAGQPREPDQWGSIAAWSWGLSRALDYFETDPAIDARRVAVQGHSRYGKTALVAGAFDERFAIVWPSCSGSMGASLEKRNNGETIDNVASSSEYHWMAGNFLKYGGDWDAMPVDAHLLMAAIAPRPLFVTAATEDSWTDQEGMFLAAVAAGPVYRLLGARGLQTEVMPPPDTTLADGDLAWRMHEGGHTDAPDWEAFLAFAGRYLGR